MESREAIGRDAWSMESTDRLERQWTLGEQIDGNSRRLAAASGPPGRPAHGPRLPSGLSV